MEWIKNNKKNIILCLVLILGFAVRLVAIDKYPQGLNVDEASAGYEAYSILNYGIDRNRQFITCIFGSMGKWTKCFI